MTRALGVDLGSKRIGVALSDSAGILATPLEVVHRSGKRSLDHARLANLVAEHEVEIIVVGLPLALSGQVTSAARSALHEVAEIVKRVPVPVVTYDERFTTVTAEQYLMDQNMRAPARRKIIDKVAAAVLLQAWLDAGSPSSPPGEEDGR